MKRLGFLLFFVCVTIACSSDEDKGTSEYPQKWVLVKITGQLSDQELTGDEMDWQEYYTLNSNGTFQKHREYEGTVFEAEGAYEFVTENGDNLLKLTFQGDNNIVGSCYGNQTEFFWIISETRMRSTWLACDGPGLEYERLE